MPAQSHSEMALCETCGVYHLDHCAELRRERDDLLEKLHWLSAAGRLSDAWIALRIASDAIKMHKEVMPAYPSEEYTANHTARYRRLREQEDRLRSNLKHAWAEYIAALPIEPGNTSERA